MFFFVPTRCITFRTTPKIILLRWKLTKELGVTINGRRGNGPFVSKYHKISIVIIQLWPRLVAYKPFWANDQIKVKFYYGSWTLQIKEMFSFINKVLRSLRYLLIFYLMWSFTCFTFNHNLKCSSNFVWNKPYNVGISVLLASVQSFSQRIRLRNAILMEMSVLGSPQL